MNRTRHTFPPAALPLLLTVLLLVLPVAAGTAVRDPVGAVIENLLGRPGPVPTLNVGGESLRLTPELESFYRQRSFAPVWTGPSSSGAPADTLLDILRGAGEDGLCPDDYQLAAIAALRDVPAARLAEPAVSAPWRARLDLLLSDAFLRYARDLATGRIDPRRALDGWRGRPRAVAAGRLLERVAAGARLQEVVEQLRPAHPEYRRLRQTLADYRRRWVHGGWPQVPPGPVLRPGQIDSRLPLLRARLQAGGDLAEDAGEGSRYDPVTVAALKAFQRRHGLADDGVLGPRTLAAMNVPLARRLQQLELNLERWRLVPDDFGQRHLRVNIPDFSLALVVDGRQVLSMAAVVGTPRRKTPVFSARLRYLEFAPYWYVPPTILREDIIPRVRRDPGMLPRQHFEVVSWDGRDTIAPETIDWPEVSAKSFPGLLRQSPGPWNPLGGVKFMLPNPYAVYLHDTPNRALFERRTRAFSSGCIRIERPFELAARLLTGAEAPDLAGALARMTLPGPLRTDLAEPLPVHILYFTAWVDDKGRPHFREDIYHQDIGLEMALDSSPRFAYSVIARSGERPERTRIQRR